MDFREALLRVIGEWEVDPILDEWVFEKFRQEVVKRMTSADAFDAIGPTVDILLMQVDESTSTELVQTLIGLAAQSNTTEIPSNLSLNVAKIQAQFSNLGPYAQDKLHELLRKYRF